AEAEEPPPPGHRVDQAYAALLESGFAEDDGGAEDQPAVEEPLVEEPLAEDREADDDVAAPVEDELGDLGDEDSFVLPHWTEPPTGQVPKVVVGESPEPDALATYGSQPRWRDEGEWDDADFDDLIEERPRLGALAGDDDVADDFFDDDYFADDD